MDLFESMKVFVQIVEKGSLSAAAQTLAISATMVGKHLQMLEQRLQASLMQRTTRKQQLTPFGQDYYLRCKQILSQVEQADASALAQQQQASGILRVTAPVSFGAAALVPQLGRYLAQHPQLKLDLHLHDHVFDLVDAGFEAAIRIGDLNDDRLIARPLQRYNTVICAAPDYLQRYGMPRLPQDLAHHACLAYSHGDIAEWRLYQEQQKFVVKISGPLQLNQGWGLHQAALAGLGIIMQPEVLVRADLASGKLVRLLPDYQLSGRPMHIVYLPDRYRTQRLRSFVDFVVANFS